MKYFRLMRVQHYLKNVLIFLPLVFSGMLLHKEYLLEVFIGTISFSLLSSVIYIINDIHDINEDKNHPIKCKRPIASGEVKISKAKYLAVILLIISSLLNMYVGKQNIVVWSIFLLYLVVNAAYSLIGLKNVPLLDVVLLVSGFFLRVLYGSEITGISISAWFNLVIISGAFYLGFGKRRNEIDNSINIRKILKYYNQNFLDLKVNHFNVHYKNCILNFLTIL